MSNNRGKPASFILNNSKGYPDFIMTMLIYFSLALFLLLILWVLAQYFGLRFTAELDPETANDHPFITYMKHFNDTLKTIVLGVSGSVFALATSYMLRRKFHDDHFLAMKRLDNTLPGSGVMDMVSGFLQPGQSSKTHPHYDNEEEDA